MMTMSRRRTSSSSSRRRRGGFRLGRKLARVFRWAPFFFLFRRKRYQQPQMDVDSQSQDYYYYDHTYNPQIEETNETNNTHCNSNNKLAKLCSRWGKSLAKVKELVCSNNNNNTNNSTSNSAIKSSRRRHRHRHRGRPAGNYIRLGGGDCGSEKKNENENRKEGLRVPKGHLALYVGGKEEETLQRVVIPVIYLNHPSFEKLLKEAEDVYGFDQPGRISIPCPFSEFDSVLRSTKNINTTSTRSRWCRGTRLSSDYRSKPQL